MLTIPAHELEITGMNAPLMEVEEIFKPTSESGASRYRRTLPDDRYLDALLVNAESDTLIVTFHGALDRKTWALPRFERLKSTREFGHSMLFFSDPGLWANESLQLSWFAGWPGYDLTRVLAEWTRSAALAIGATKVIFTGSSGGGFAALQTSALVPNSICLCFNPQTSIYGYRIDGNNFGAQRKFIEVFHREIAPDGDVNEIDFTEDWSVPFGESLSPLLTYSTPRENYVLYADNINDFHHDQHLAPLVDVMNDSGNDSRFRVHSYEGAHTHNPPIPEHFRSAMEEALIWSTKIPDTY